VPTIKNVKEINQSSDIILSIIANKSDLYEERNISEEEGKKFAADNHSFFFETSFLSFQLLLLASALHLFSLLDKDFILIIFFPKFLNLS